ncbi:MAG: MATE family efflux transporter [Methanobrevibacter sp.]|nr:MATE family efflux transporter [Candidatus Methanoflexus mossambicus]
MDKINNKSDIEDIKSNNSVINNNNEIKETKGVSTLLGDPKNAVLKMSIPMIIAMVINSLYSVIDGVWVAGLGGSALAAIGFVNPIYMIVFGFANGLGAGATAIISRYIGAKNKKMADNAALHVIILTIIMAIIFTIIFTLFLRPILLTIGAGQTIDLCMDYGQILFTGSIFIVFSSSGYGLLRAEGNVNKTTYAMFVGAVLNMVLDPLFIYYLNLGVSGAAIATLLSMAFVCVILLYWFKGETYIDFNLKNFIYSNKLIKQILSVGLPAGAEFLIIAILSGTLNLILAIVAGIDGVAVYTAGWRVVLIGMVPPISIGIAIVAVTGANFGGARLHNLKIIHNYGIKLSFLIALAISIIVFIAAPYISYIFAYSPETAGLRDTITDFLRVTSLFYIFLPLGVSSASIFQGLGKGLHSLTITMIRILILEVLFAYILAIPLNIGQYGVWYGMVIGNAIGSIIAYVWAKLHIKKLHNSNIGGG